MATTKAGPNALLAQLNASAAASYAEEAQSATAAVFAAVGAAVAAAPKGGYSGLDADDDTMVQREAQRMARAARAAATAAGRLAGEVLLAALEAAQVRGCLFLVSALLITLYRVGAARATGATANAVGRLAGETLLGCCGGGTGAQCCLFSVTVCAPRLTAASWLAPSMLGCAETAVIDAKHCLRRTPVVLRLACCSTCLQAAAAKATASREAAETAARMGNATLVQLAALATTLYADQAEAATAQVGGNLLHWLHSELAETATSAHDCCIERTW